MQVNDLIKMLQIEVNRRTWVGELEVWMSKDGEGNEFRTMGTDYTIVRDAGGDPDIEIDSDGGVLVLWPTY